MRKLFEEYTWIWVDLVAILVFIISFLAFNQGWFVSSLAEFGKGR